MADDRNQNIVRWLQASASMASTGNQDEAEIPIFSRIDNTLPRFFVESALRSQTVQPPRAPRRVYPSCMVDEAEDVIPLESDSDLGSEATPAGSEDEEEHYFGIEDDEGADGIAEWQHQNHHANASTPVGLSNSDGGLRSSSLVASPLPVVFTDPDLLDCPICLEPLCAPIYQCENGHIACSPCCRKSNLKCPSCYFPIGFNRCRAMEKVIESITVDCKNKAYGCRESLIYHMKAQHEQVCIHTVCFCPLSSCGYASSSQNLYDHFSTYHSSSATSFTFDTTFDPCLRRGQKYVILQERNEGVIFILNHEIHGHGRVFHVDCLGSNLFKTAFVYQLSVRCSEACFSMESVAEVWAKWEEHTPKKNYLTIPSSGYLLFNVEVCIKKAYPVV
ncbi:putative E3 ubiquitin-protein ligase SINA-like 9 [Lactuca sativa]|uniref:RING-type E3 ubiquitin transferase n=1 Tax=Lactuca sativa TaxID=4236 RepID=A0A9R1XR50_LACSA|nr:putative E3 ubiquitin-protein ligase SINA-like 9 [Lactuca sativa]KAJ0222696.1 hypothetical protein LSAT_V11C200079420 [Lactuca sativa]